MREVRLVAVAASGRHIRPIHRPARGHLLYNLLEPVQAAIEFWREPNLFAEQLREAAAAEAGD